MGVHGFGYARSTIHRIIPKFLMQAGDYRHRDGTGGRAVFLGGVFEDENFVKSHSKIGVLSMVNESRNRNGSQFFIHMAVNDWYDGTHVVFGLLLWIYLMRTLLTVTLV
jgi:cyclophilin family peptidyl-prolyl cis-trans isomerase